MNIPATLSYVLTIHYLQQFLSKTYPGIAHTFAQIFLQEAIIDNAPEKLKIHVLFFRLELTFNSLLLFQDAVFFLVKNNISEQIKCLTRIIFCTRAKKEDI